MRTQTSTPAARGALLVLSMLASRQAAAQPTAGLERTPVAAPAERLRTGAAEPLVGELRVPAGRGPFPVAIVVHGGCWLTRFADDRYMRPLAESLRDEGIATWSVRYRRVDEPGGRWPGTYRDLAAAADSVRALARRWPLDTSRVIVVGHSAGAPLGGWLAARPFLAADDATVREARGGAGTTPLRIRGVVAIDGPLDLRAARPIGRPVCGMDVVDSLLGGSPEAQPARWRVASPASVLAPSPRGVRQAVVIGGLDAGTGASVGAATTLRAYAPRAGAAVFVADTTDHFSMLDPMQPAWAATRDGVRHALGLPPEGRAGADRAALRAAYRTIERAFLARALDPAIALLAPEFEHRGLDERAAGGVRVTPRAAFVERLGRLTTVVDTMYAFAITVTDVAVRGDSADVTYSERADMRVRPPNGAAVRDSATSWWRDRWVRTAAGWRALRFEETPPPAARPR